LIVCTAALTLSGRARICAPSGGAGSVWRVILVVRIEPIHRAPISAARLDELRAYLRSGKPAIYVVDRESLLALVAEIDRLNALLDKAKST
jgi:hypothetical protein